MSFSFDKMFGIHGQAIAVRSRRMQVIASNLANADTPNYLARDLDFREMLGRAGTRTLATRRTDPRHLGGQPAPGPAQLKYRIPLQPAVDGNTVDTQFEQTSFADNAIRFQASLMFLDGRIRGLSDAITGGLR